MSKLELRIFDGSRQPFAGAADFLITITDGNQKQHVRDYFRSNDSTFDLPFFDNFGDDYSVVVWASGYQQAGFMPVKLSDQKEHVLDIMLVPTDPGFNFAQGQWAAAKVRYPFLGGDIAEADAETRYANLLETQEKPAACLLNLGEAMSQIALTTGTPLDYIKQLRWDGGYAPAQDRFFAWCDPAMIDQVKIGAKNGEFAEELNPGIFHPGATSSWKQIQFGEANVQLTFHENERQKIGDVECIMIEPDIDYYKDLGAHTLLEVIPNAVTHTLTEPTEVYVLRWIAARSAGAPDFEPLYTIVS